MARMSQLEKAIAEVKQEIQVLTYALAKLEASQAVYALAKLEAAQAVAPKRPAKAKVTP